MKATLRKNGDMLLHFDTEEAALLIDLPRHLRDVLLRQDQDDPSIARLLPSASTCPRTAAEYRVLVGDQLRETKLDRIDAFEGSLNSARVGKSGVEFLLTPEGFEVWLGFLNDMRLMIGTQLNITDDWEPDVEDHDSLLYLHLTYLQGNLIDLDPMETYEP